MRIAEIFHSIQGEGLLAGIPSVFIRTSGCNLRCSWCDTPYASWSPEGKTLTEDEIVAGVLAFPSTHVVVTGGEPVLAPGLSPLLHRLRDHARHLTIETAGTLPPDGLVCDLASISPKLANSTPTTAAAGPGWAARHEQRRLQPDTLRRWIEEFDFQLKFVVSAEGDLDEIADVLRAIGRPIDPGRVLLMPEGTDAATLDARGRWLVDICKRTGYRFCPRLHVHLFGNTRGT
jgi:7-carboxy-7-deazaguanine synthase